MIVQREKIYNEKDGIYINTIKRTSWWLLGVIPIFVKNEIIKRF